jgi:hypothetical protein
MFAFCYIKCFFSDSDNLLYCTKICCLVCIGIQGVRVQDHGWL